MKIILIVLLGLLAACGPEQLEPPPDYVCSTTAAITNGYDSVDRRATVRLNSCSGTIIGPHTVLTAAHCTPDSAENLFVAVQGDDLYQVARTLPHPDYTGPAYDDLALQYVAETLPEPYAEIALPSAGECYYMVQQGYGRTEDEGWGRLHESPAYILSTHPDLITYEGPNDAQICFGDSGGPLYAVTDNGDLLLISLHSKLVDPNCQDGYGMGPNLQTHIQWITDNTF